MANYLEQYQYQPIQAANTNIEQIAKTYQMKMAYFEQGASQVKSAYQNYVGLDLSRTDNQQSLSEFMKGAKQKIQAASMTDLSVGDNVASTLGVFDELTKGETEFSKNIMGDHMLTKFYKDEINKAESFKNAKDFDGYNEKNVTHLRNKLQDFTNARNPGDWKSFYANRQSYTPYHDVSKETTTILKEFDPSSIVTQRAKDGYIFKSEDISTMPEDVKRYLSSRLSDKAKRQLEIEGSVNFYGREDVLRTTYTYDANNDLKELRDKKEAITRKMKLSPKKDQESLRIQSDDFDNQIKNQISYLNRMEDEDFFIKNRDHYAGKVQLNSYLDNVAIGMARSDIKQTMSPDTKWMQDSSQAFQERMKIAQWSFDANENALDRANRLDVASIAHSGKVPGGTGGTGNPNYSDGSGTREVPVSTEDGTYKPDDALTTATTDLDSSMARFAETSPQFKAAFSEATSISEKQKVFDSFMSVKQKALEDADNELSDWKVEHPKATAIQIDEKRKALYTLNRVNDLIDYKDKLETYNLAKMADDNKVNNLLNEALGNVTEDQVFDASGVVGNTGVRNVKVLAKDYRNMLTGDNNLLQLKNINYKGKPIQLNEDQRKQILKQSLQIRLRNKDLNSEESLKIAMENVIGGINEGMKTQATNILKDKYSWTDSLESDAEFTSKEFEVVRKAYPQIKGKQEGNTIKVKRNQFASRTGAVDIDERDNNISFETYIGKSKIDIKDNTQALYKRYDAGRDASPNLTKADKQFAVQVTNEDAVKGLKERHEGSANKTDSKRQYENFYSLPDGTIYGTYVGEDKKLAEEIIERNDRFAFDKANALTPKYKALNAYFLQSLGSKSSNIYSPTITNTKNQQFRISFTNKNDGNFYGVEQYMPDSKYADKDGWVSVSHNALTTMEQVQKSIEGK